MRYHRFLLNLTDSQRVIIFSVNFIVVFLIFQIKLGWQLSFLLSWVFAGIYFLISILFVITQTDGALTKQKCMKNDSNSSLLIGVIIVATLLSNLAVGVVLHALADHHPHRIKLLLGLGVSVILISWAMLNSTFAFHYSRLYYDTKDKKGSPFSSGIRTGFVFAECNTPSFLDFFYLSFGIGLNYSVSDVVINRTEIRAVVLIHSFFSFIFYSTVVTIFLNTLISSWTG